MIARLVHSLDALTRDAAKLRHPAAERLVELAAVATAYAVALETVRAERAEAAWREAHTPAPMRLETEVELPELLAA
jgi:hypothetical protein